MAELGIVTSLVNKVVDLLIAVAKKEISYMWNSKENVAKLKNEADKLKLMREKVQQQIDGAEEKGDKLIVGVEKWMKDADEEISKAEKFIDDEAIAKKTCFKIAMCGNWATLHRYGKEATEKTPALVQHQVSGMFYESCVSVCTPAPGPVDTPAPGPLDVYQIKNLDDLVTHNSALEAIIAALEADSIQIIGIYGLGGVGKTTLAMEAAVRVKHLFADVAFTTVSQNVDVEKIKKDIQNATKRIMNGEKVLIILDDVWETLNIQELLIPCGSGHKYCKILLTSRNRKVCNKMNAGSKICVECLPPKEAWILFKRVVGDDVETDVDKKPVAMKVAEECGGLPLLIEAVGHALKEENLASWKAALAQLQKGAPAEIKDPDIRKAYTHLKLSYDYLDSEEAKSCFLLCSLFPEDRYIKLEELVGYGVGLEKFHNLDSMVDARNEVRLVVNILTSSGLLLDNGWEGSTKMHDVVRDVALLIASEGEGENKYLVKAGKGLTEWLPRENSLKSYTGISLMNNRISKLPDYKVHLQHLQIFIINDNDELPMISDEFIEGMKQVKVLDMRGCRNAQLPQSLKLLTNLRMLNLQGNKSFNEISILGEMKELEILILNETGIKEIPQELGQLENLRWLEVKDCVHLSHLTPHVISKLLRLEELCIDLRRVCEGVCACIVDVRNLSMLTYLDLTVQSFDVIPDGFNSENLKDCVIQIEEGSNVSRPDTILDRVINLKTIIPDLYNKGFNKLEYIKLNRCPDVSCLVDSTRCDWDQGKTSEKFFMELKDLILFKLDKLEVIWKCPDEYLSLANLVRLDIKHCHKLERVFRLSVAQGLNNLKELEIGFCDGLEELIWGGGGDDDEEINRGDTEIVKHYSANAIVFPSLANISLRNLSSLISFCSVNCSIQYPSLEKVIVRECKSMEIWGIGIHETPNLKFLNSDVPIPGLNATNEAVEE